MSLKIRVPAKVAEDAANTPQSSASEHQSRRRLVQNKRRIAIDSDDEEEEGNGHDNQTQATEVPDSPYHGGTSPVDILSNEFGGSSSPPLTRHASEAPSQASASTSTIPVKRTKPKAGEDKGRPSKKRRAAAAAYTDSEEDDFVAAAGQDPDDLDDWEPEGKIKKVAKKGKGKATGVTAGKGKAGGKAASVAKREGTPPVTGAKRGRGKALSAPGEEAVDSPMEGVIDATNVAEDPTPAPSAAAVPAPPKKKKLPPIKKIKATPTVAAPTTATTTPTTASANATNSVLAELGMETKSASRKIPATLGNADLDLMNASVYKDLFGSGGNASRSVMSRREKEEERRKELNRMREEAKAKRLAEAVPPFDLQGQADKIARFDEVLKSRRSSALWPNHLGAKWRELAEQEKERREREKQREREGGWQMNQQSQARA